MGCGVRRYCWRVSPLRLLRNWATVESPGLKPLLYRAFIPPPEGRGFYRRLALRGLICVDPYVSISRGLLCVDPYVSISRGLLCVDPVSQFPEASYALIPVSQFPEASYALIPVSQFPEAFCALVPCVFTSRSEVTVEAPGFNPAKEALLPDGL
jgi:hypothetical protein